MGKALNIVIGASAGALAVYFMDPRQGRRRRAIVRDKVYGQLSGLDEAGNVIAVDLRNRAQGLFAGLRQRVSTEDVPDEVLVERVRSRLGRAVSHPSAIEVQAHAGAVTLQGLVLEHELKRVLRAVRSVPGVRSIDNRLEAHETRGDISSLQGGMPRSEVPEIAQQNWAPGTRLVLGMTGGAMVLRAMARRTPMAFALALPGVVLLARAATNIDFKRLIGARGRRGIDFTKTLHVEAPVHEVFEFWSNFENFPKFMRNVRAVRKNRDDSWHWEVAGPLGASVEWDSQVTQSVPDQLIAWATIPGMNVQHAGTVRFDAEGGGTRVHIRMSYNPVAGALGHAVASLLGADALTEMDEDLMRMKSYLESGKAPRDAAQARSPG